MFLFKRTTSCVLATTILLSSLSTITPYATTPQDTINENLSKYKQLDSEILALDKALSRYLAEAKNRNK